MIRRNIVMLVLAIVAAFAIGSLTANTQTALESLKSQHQSELLKRQNPVTREQPDVIVNQGQQGQRGQRGQQEQKDDLSLLKAQIEQLQDRVDKLEREIVDMRRPKIDRKSVV